jgi:hypothetical protein
MEDCKLIDDAQEAFRRGRITKHQLGKLHSILAEQRRRKASLSVMQNLDIKNAFSADWPLAGRARSGEARWRRSEDLLTNRLAAARARWRRGNPCPAAGPFRPWDILERRRDLGVARGT